MLIHVSGSFSVCILVERGGESRKEEGGRGDTEEVEREREAERDVH